LIEPQPAYQASPCRSNLATTLNSRALHHSLSTPQRVSPDVAMVAIRTPAICMERPSPSPAISSPTPAARDLQTQEYCENGEGGTSLASPLMAGVIAVMNEKRNAGGEPLVGLPIPCCIATAAAATDRFHASGLNQIVAPENTRVGAARLFQQPQRGAGGHGQFRAFPHHQCALCARGLRIDICEGVNDVFNYTSLASAAFPRRLPATTM